MIDHTHLSKFEVELKELLQIKDNRQVLDSLETIVLKSFLKSSGVEINNLSPVDNTIEGWLNACSYL